MQFPRPYPKPNKSELQPLGLCIFSYHQLPGAYYAHQDLEQMCETLKTSRRR